MLACAWGHALSGENPPTKILARLLKPPRSRAIECTNRTDRVVLSAPQFGASDEVDTANHLGVRTVK